MRQCISLLIGAGMLAFGLDAAAQQSPDPTTSPVTDPHALTIWNGQPPDLMPNELALSSEIQHYLEGLHNGPDGLFQILTGKPRTPNQTLLIHVPKEAIKMGSIRYDKTAKIRVHSLTKGIENCNSPSPNTQRIQTSETVTNTSSWSHSTSTDTSTTYNVNVSATAKFPFDTGEVTTTFDFDTRKSTDTTDTKSGETQTSRTLTIDTRLTAKPGRSEFYRTEVVQLVGDQTTFYANASVNSSAPIRFFVQTNGYIPELRNAVGNPTMIGVLDNSPLPGHNAPLGDKDMSNLALVSPTGAFAFYLQNVPGYLPKYSGQDYALVDLSRSVGSNAYLWFGNATKLSDSLVFILDRRFNWSDPTWFAHCTAGNARMVMRADGALVWYCGTQAINYTNTSIQNGNPCFYLTWKISDKGDIGQPACYKRDVSGMTSAEADKYLVWESGLYQAAGPVNKGTQFYQVTSRTLNEIAGVHEKNFRFKGTYSGSQVISPTELNCEYGFDLLTGSEMQQGQGVRSNAGRHGGRRQDSEETEPAKRTSHSREDSEESEGQQASRRQEGERGHEGRKRAANDGNSNSGENNRNRRAQKRSPDEGGDESRVMANAAAIGNGAVCRYADPMANVNQMCQSTKQFLQPYLAKHPGAEATLFDR